MTKYRFLSQHKDELHVLKFSRLFVFTGYLLPTQCKSNNRIVHQCEVMLDDSGPKPFFEEANLFDV